MFNISNKHNYEVLILLNSMIANMNYKPLRNTKKLVDMGKAYVCTCNADKWRELKNEGKACSCRCLGKQENQLRLKRAGQ